MKVLELTNYSAGGCGVWARVKRESQLLASKGHEVRVFSSNFTKGSKEIAARNDRLGNIAISRFPGTKLGGESFIYWNFKREAIAFKPDVIIAHSYRHPHTLTALKIAKKINAKVFLVTHAPFDRSSTRSLVARLVISFYDRFIGRNVINRFDKVIAISHWEEPYLRKLGLRNDKRVFIPNGIMPEFFLHSSKKSQPKILYMGRVSPIKNLEILINALAIVKRNMPVKIYGPAEPDYLKKLKAQVKENNLEQQIEFVDCVYTITDHIKELDNTSIFILPSISEGMPQVLVEAMARGKIVIASDNKGNADIVQHGKTGFLFKNGNAKDLAAKIDLALSLNLKQKSQMSNSAMKSVEKYSWSTIIKKIESLF